MYNNNFGNNRPPRSFDNRNFNNRNPSFTEEKKEIILAKKPFYARNATVNMMIGGTGSLMAGFATGHPMAGIIGVVPAVALGRSLYEFGNRRR